MNSPDDELRQPPQCRWRNWHGAFFTLWLLAEKLLNVLKLQAVRAAMAGLRQSPQIVEARGLLLKVSTVVLAVATKSRSCSRRVALSP